MLDLPRSAVAIVHTETWAMAGALARRRRSLTTMSTEPAEAPAEVVTAAVDALWPGGARQIGDDSALASPRVRTDDRRQSV